MKLEIQAVGFRAGQKLKQLIEKRLTKYTERYPWILGGKVILKIENASDGKNKEVEVKLKIPGNYLFAKSIEDEFSQAIDKVIEAIRRQLKKFKERDLIKPRTNSKKDSMGMDSFF